jgi:RimJ/RimL family protein N-acetyltransferase
MPLSSLTPADIAEVMRIERLPGYEATVGRFEVDEHASQMARDDVRYVGVREGDGLAGFVILQDFDQPSVLLRRIAVSRQDGGIGSWLVRATMDWVFETTRAQALRLEVALNNPRGKFVYERQGFAVDGADAVHHFLSIPRERWAASRGG